MCLHEVPALVAFLGGLALFGASGIVLGPAALAVTVAVLEVWRGRLGAEAPGALAEGVPAPSSREAATVGQTVWGRHPQA
jgi:predicted PurR-regulated permease PerM